MKTNKIYRHGDILITEIKELPRDAKLVEKSDKYILAYGEVTGHKHLITLPKPELEILQDASGRFYMKVGAKGLLTHEEHKTIEIEPAIYRIDHEREYDYYLESIKRVQD